MLDPVPRRFHRVLSPVSSPVASAFPERRLGRLPAFVPRITTPRRPVFRGCRYFFMFRPPRLLTPQIVPTAPHTAAGQPGLLHPGLSCFVTSTRSGYANRPNTGNGRYRDLHPVRLSALSAAHFAPRTLLRFIANTDPSATLSPSTDFPVEPVIRSPLLR